MKLVPLTKGMYAKVDDEDFDNVSRYRWRCGTGNYACSVIDGKPVSMHRYLLNVDSPHLKVDHINHDTVDNRRFNLRICTHQQNMANTLRKKQGISRYKGVCPRKDQVKKVWRAQICVNYKVMSLGNYKTEEAAARAYNEAALRYFGEYANVNVLP